MYFFTDQGQPIPAVSREKMLEIDQIATVVIELSLLQMMENAGRNLALSALDLMGKGWQKAHYLILAGSGGNGGGAICAARHLANRRLKVGLCLLHPDRLSPAAARQLKIFKSSGGKLLSFTELAHFRADIILDGLIGYSLNGAPREKAQQFINWANLQPGLKLALDIPSGIDANSGQAAGDFFQADLTMTLALPKEGLQNPACGRLLLADIGITEKCYQLAGLQFESDFWQNRYRIEIFRKNDK